MKTRQQELYGRDSNISEEYRNTFIWYQLSSHLKSKYLNKSRSNDSEYAFVIKSKHEVH